MLESTNVSSKNAFIKKNLNKPEKMHKRYGSAEIYKSPQQFEKKKLKRKSSMENIPFSHNPKVIEKKTEERKDKIEKKK